MSINKNIIKLKIGQNSISNPVVKSKYNQTISTSGIQEAFADSNLVDDYFLKGGYKVVSDITCRNNIPCEYRKLGMQVMVVGPDASFKKYVLKGNDPCSNEGWEELINATNEVEVKLVEDYSVLGSTLDNQRDLNLYFKNNLITLNESLGDFVDKVSDQTIDGTKSFLQGINLKNSTLDVNSSNRTLRFSENTFTYPSVVKDSILTGYNILPLLNPLVSGNETWLNGAGYIAYGIDIFKDFTGNTSYRPSHNAHDSWLGFGRRLGYGVLDGTNITLIGTDVFNRNVTKYWDSITAIGKGIHTGLTVGSHIPNGDTPFYPISKPTFNMRGLVGQIVAIGAEQWFGDLHTSITIGNSIKKYKYGFNSVIIGNEIQNYPDSTVTQQQIDENSFDNDVIIGNGLWKNPNRYAQTHNLIIGNQTGYGAGGWSSAYIPLIEGNFKTPFLRINGKLSNTDERSLYTPDASYHQSGYLTRPLSLVSIPTGASESVTFDSTTGNLTFTNAPAGRYVLAENIPSGTYFYTALNSNMSRTYNMRILSYSYNNAVLGFPYADMYVYSDGTYPTNEFAIELTDTTSGTIQCVLKYVDSSNLIRSIDKVYDKDKNLVLETKTSTLANSTVLVGSEVAKKYFTGINNAIFGNFNLSIASRLNSSSIVGTNNAKLLEAADKIIIVGNNNLNKLTYGNQIFCIGTNNFPNATNMQWSYTFGDSNFTNFIGGPTEDTTYNSNLIGIGRGVAVNLISGQNAILMGRNTGYGATSINNSIAIMPKNSGENTFGTSTPDNAIVISGNATTGFGNNTTTIGNPSTVASYIYGDLFKIKSINFDLKSSITPTPNTLIPKTDGSGLIWYDNNSVGSEIGANKLDKGTYTGNAQDLKNEIDGKANISHTHEISSITNLQTSLDTINNDINNLEGINYVWSPTNRTLTLFDSNGTQLSQVSLVSLDNEGTDIRYNASTLSLELYNVDNQLLDSIPVSSFIGSVGTQLQLNSNELQLKDSKGNVLSTVSFTVSNIQGLQSALDGKLNKGSYPGNASDLKNEIDGKLNKPTLISDGNVPKWNSSVENFVAGDITNTSDGKIGISKPNPTESLDVNGNVKAIDFKGQSVKFNLQTSISPTPNTLVPKTDGSGLVWYDNNSTPADLGFKTKVIPIDSNTVLSEVHNNNIILITDNCTITIPSGLSQDFNCVFMVKGAFTATFIQGSGAKIYAPNGLLLKTDSKASFFYESSNNYILTGELTTS